MHRSFTVGNENGTKHDAQTVVTPSGPAYRQIMSVLGRFMGGLDLDRLAPEAGWIAFETAGDDATTAAGAVAAAGSPHATTVARVSALAPTRAVLANIGLGSVHGQRTYAAFVPASVNAIKVNPQAGVRAEDTCKCEWLDTVTGKVTPGPSVRTGSWTSVSVPEVASKAGVALTVAC